MVSYRESQLLLLKLYMYIHIDEVYSVEATIFGSMAIKEQWTNQIVFKYQ